MNLLRLSEAARELGVSYTTLKQWIYRGRVRSVKTPGGHHRIPRGEIDRLLFQRGPRGRGAAPATPVRVRGSLSTKALAGSGLEHLISGRNQLVGRVAEVEVIGLLAKVTLDVGGQRVTAIITRDACLDLELKVGDAAAALIKATEVMIIRPASKSR
jgi:molybdopterin-binding protein